MPRTTEGVGFVDVDNALGARLAVDHLVAPGRRRIATIAGPPDMVAGRTRLRGLPGGAGRRRASTPTRALVATGDFSQDSGEAAMRDLLGRCPDLDGVFCANDLMAAGALRVLRESGRSVPDDVAVVGFDDSPLALTTAPAAHHGAPVPRAHGARDGRAAARDPGPRRRPAAGRVLPTHLVVRGSS